MIATGPDISVPYGTTRPTMRTEICKTVVALEEEVVAKAFAITDCTKMKRLRKWNVN